jgi:hypothetical protein
VHAPRVLGLVVNWPQSVCVSVFIGIFDAAKVGIMRLLMVFTVLLFFEDDAKSAFQWKKWRSSLRRRFSRLTWEG